MSAWMVSRVVAAGGHEIPQYDDHEWLTVYRGFLLRWTDSVLHAARFVGFDRWANSRIYDGDPPTTIEELDTLLDGLATVEDPFSW